MKLNYLLPLWILIIVLAAEVNIMANNTDSLLDLYNKERNDSNKIDLLNRLAVRIRLSYPDSSKKFAEKAVEIARKSGLKKREGISLTNIAGIESNQGHYEDALTHFLQAAKIFDSLHSQKGLAAVYANMSGIYAFKKDYKKALSYQQNALSIFTQRKDTSSLIYSYNQIGNIYSYQNNYQEARTYYESALELSELIHEQYSMACALGNVASCYSSMGELNKALEDCLKAIALLEKTGSDRINLATMYANTGDLYIRLNKLEEALNYINKGLDLANELKHKRTIKYCYELLATVYENKKNFEKALYFHRLYSNLKDSLLNEENVKSITEMQTKYETEKKEQEIELLNKDKLLKEIEFQKQEALITKTTTQRNSLIGIGIVLIGISILLFFYIRTKRISEKVKLEKQLIELEQKALSLQMNPHFIFNSINSISSFISQNNSLSAKKYLAKFAKLMRLILENSRETLIPIQREIETLEYYMELEQLRFSNKFDFKIQLSEDIDPALVTMPPMLLQPQVENAILHGIVPKENTGSITINFYLNASKLICEVIDDGIGRQQSSELNKERAKTHKSLGMQVTIERLEVITSGLKSYSGIRIDDLADSSGNPSGTKIIFELPFQTIEV